MESIARHIELLDRISKGSGDGTPFVDVSGYEHELKTAMISINPVSDSGISGWAATFILDGVIVAKGREFSFPFPVTITNVDPITLTIEATRSKHA